MSCADDDEMNREMVNAEENAAATQDSNNKTILQIVGYGLYVLFAVCYDFCDGFLYGS
jgi:hypothetical protein